MTVATLYVICEKMMREFGPKMEVVLPDKDIWQDITKQIEARLYSHPYAGSTDNEICLLIVQKPKE